MLQSGYFYYFGMELLIVGKRKKEKGNKEFTARLKFVSIILINES